MWIVFFSLFVLPLFGSLASFEEDPSSFLAITDGDSSSNIAGCVSAITGDYLISEDDFRFEGVDPTIIRRNYISSRSNEKGTGWHFELPRATFHVGEPVNVKKGLFGLINVSYRGIGFRFIPDGKQLRTEDEVYRFEKDARFRVDPTSFEVGLTNYSNGEIGEQHRLLQAYAIFRANLKSFTVYFPDGRELYFEAILNQPNYREPAQTPYPLKYECIREKLENGNYIEYTYMPNVAWHSEELSGIRTLDPTQKHVLSNVRYQYEKKDKKQKGLPSLILYGSDGKKIRFENWYSERKVYWALQNIQGTEGPDEAYTYDLFYPKKYVRNTLITRRILPDGRSMRIEYYTAGDHVVQGRSIHVSSSGYDKHYLKVKRIYAQIGNQGREIPIYEFLYHWERGTENAGSTDVYDVLGNLTRYHYDNFLRLVQIETHEKDQIVKRERFKWGSIKDHPSIYLFSKSIVDGNDTPISAKTYHYDNDGNLILERAYGNWTGSQTTPLAFDEFGRPKEGTGEIVDIVKTYTEDSRHLLESSQEGDLETRYTYIKGAIKLSSILQLDRGQIARRKFFLYDQYLFLQATIEDDGNTSGMEDLSGVTQRTIERYINRTDAPYIGLPSRIEKRYLDLSTMSEKLLHAEERTYGQHAKVLSTKIFDENYQYLYTINYERDGKGKIISETNPLGQIARYEYDGCQNKTHERHFDGTTETQFIYDTAGRNISNILKTRNGSYIESYAYNSQSKIKEKIDALGQKTHYVYNPLGKLIEQRSPPVERSSGEVASDVEKWSYDLLGCVTTATSPSNAITQITYSTAAKPLEVLHPNGAQESYYYDLRARLIRHNQADSTEILYEYDAFSRPLLKKTISYSGDLLAQEEWTYNGFHLLSHKAPSGVITHYTYDGAGRKIAEEIAGSDLVKEFEYNGFDLLIEERAKTSQHTQVFRKKYDLLNRVIWEGTLSNNEIVIEKFYTYDSHSNCIKTEWKKGDESAVHLKEYDDLDRLILQKDPEGLSTSYTYEEVEDDRFYGKVLKKTQFDPKGYLSIELFDPKDRVIESITADLYKRPLQRELKIYHPSGTIDKLVTQVFHSYEVHDEIITLYEIGSLGKALSQTRSANHPLSRSEYFHYDPKGRLLEHVKEDGVMIERSYNGLDQITSLKSSQGDLDYEFYYHPSGKIELAIDRIKKTRTNRQFDHLGRLLCEQLEHGVLVSFAYDDLHGKIELNLPSWGKVQYHYGDFHLEEISIHPRKSNDSFSHHFLAYNFLAEPIYEHDIDGEPIEKYYSPAGKLLSIHSPYGIHSVEDRNKAAQITSQKWISRAESQTKTYQYDSLSHLATESSSDKIRSYTYSSIHQMIEKSGVQLQYNALQELTQSGKNEIESDRAGRQTTCKLEKSTCHLKYDSLDRLIKVTSDEYCIEYEYDPFDRLVSRRIREPILYGWAEIGQETLFIWDENKLIALLDPSSRTYEEVRVLRPSTLSDWGTTIALEQDGVFYSTLSDVQGNLWQLNSPQSSREARFSSFGEPETESICHFGFLGKWQDPTTRLVYFGKRFYNPKTSSFLTKDPKGFVDGLNVYGFCKGDPLSYTDLYGLEAINPSSSFFERISSFFSQVSDGVSYACKRFGEGFYRVNEDFNIVPVFRRLGQAVGNYLQGETNPRVRERSQMLTAGVSGSRNSSQPQILATTGMLTTKKEAEVFLKSIHDKIGSEGASVITNSTDGLLLDAIEVGYQKCGGEIHATTLLVEQIKGIFNTSDKPLEEIRIVIIAHSQGGLTVANAVKLLTPQERGTLSIATFGSASLFTRTTERAVTHFVSTRDPIPLLANPVSYFTNEDVVHIDASKGKLFDHSFGNASYQGALSDFLKKNIK